MTVLHGGCHVSLNTLDRLRLPYRTFGPGFCKLLFLYRIHLRPLLSLIFLFLIFVLHSCMHLPSLLAPLMLSIFDVYAAILEVPSTTDMFSDILAFDMEAPFLYAPSTAINPSRIFNPVMYAFRQIVTLHGPMVLCIAT